MVKVIRRMAFMNAMKEAYHKSFWEGMKHLWLEFRESNQLVATYAPIAVMTCIPLIGIIFYKKIHANPTPKYYDYINIYRPDDPRVPFIRKDDSLQYTVSKMIDSMYMPNTI